MSDNEQINFLLQKAHQEEQLAAAMEREMPLLPDPPLDSPLRLTAEKAPQEVSVPGVEDALREQVAQLDRMVKELQEANRQTADQAASAEEGSKVARKQARNANIISVCAILVSILIPLVSFLVGRFTV